MSSKIVPQEWANNTSLRELDQHFSKNLQKLITNSNTKVFIGNIAGVMAMLHFLIRETAIQVWWSILYNSFLFKLYISYKCVSLYDMYIYLTHPHKVGFLKKSQFLLCKSTDLKNPWSQKMFFPFPWLTNCSGKKKNQKRINTLLLSNFSCKKSRLKNNMYALPKLCIKPSIAILSFSNKLLCMKNCVFYIWCSEVSPVFI